MIKTRTLWKCRRGTREMDLLIKNFVARHYEGLSMAEKASFNDLLDETDLDIMAWITGTISPRKDDYSMLLRLLKEPININNDA